MIEWKNLKDVKGYERFSKFEISSNGAIRYTNSKRVLNFSKGKVKNKERAVVLFSDEQGAEEIEVKLLVASAFVKNHFESVGNVGIESVGRVDNGRVVRVSGNIRDNRASSLVWVRE